MAVKYYIQSRKEYSPIWVRICEGKIDAKSRTLLIIKTDRLVKGKILPYRISASDDAEQKASIREKNGFLNDLQRNLDNLRDIIYKALNERGSDKVIDSQWLKNIVQPSIKMNLFNSNIDAFLSSRKLTIKPNSYKVYSQASGILKRYQKGISKELLLIDINMKFRDDFLLYLDDEGYSNNAKMLYINVMSQVIKFAKKRGEQVSEDYIYFKDELKKKKTLNVYLSFEEIERIQALKIDRDRDSIARDWLVISCFTAQREGDMQLFDKKNIDKKGILTIQQTKNSNSKPIRIPILPQVREIMNRYNGNFPPFFPEVAEGNRYNIYNRSIKRICKLAELDEVSKTLASKTLSSGSEVVEKKKWELIGSHIGRRSFATNYYFEGVPIFTIMSVTGHKSEGTFLLYIDGARDINEDRLMDAFKI